MITLKHPAFPEIRRTVAGDQEAAWRNAGWLPLLDDTQRARLAQLEDEVEHRCPTCDASGDQPCTTPSGKPTKRHKARG